MADDIPQRNPPLALEEKLGIARLTQPDLEAIDAAILAQTDEHWLKVARVVTWAEDVLRPRFPPLSYRFYIKRLAVLVKEEGRTIGGKRGYSIHAIQRGSLGETDGRDLIGGTAKYGDLLPIPAQRGKPRWVTEWQAWEPHEVPASHRVTKRNWSKI